MKKDQPGKPELQKAEILSLCICEGCPSYEDCAEKGGKKERAFCMSFVGKSKCITIDKGCLCGACAVKQRMKLKNLLFCIKSSEPEQNKTK